MTGHFMFDSGATRSFMSLVLSKKFSDALRTLDYLLEVEIFDDRLVSASRVHRGCVLNMFKERYSINLVLIHFRGSKVIVGIDWLGPNAAMIDCEHQLLRFRTLSKGELGIHGKGD